ncbi:MAG TPA: hypothetical protein VGR26_01600 [Acidimicrobiales bacterium]|nr:hypothetical protein [Acidimicrobiales bacterium]
MRDLRGARRKAAGVALGELRDRGCDAAGYRLSGEVIEHVCCRHLYGTDRVLTVWPADDHAVVIAIGRHDESAADVYSTLLDALELEVPDAERETTLLRRRRAATVGRTRRDRHCRGS